MGCAVEHKNHVLFGVFLHLICGALVEQVIYVIAYFIAAKQSFPHQMFFFSDLRQINVACRVTETACLFWRFTVLENLKLQVNLCLLESTDIDNSFRKCWINVSVQKNPPYQRLCMLVHVECLPYRSSVSCYFRNINVLECTLWYKPCSQKSENSTALWYCILWS